MKKFIGLLSVVLFLNSCSTKRDESVKVGAVIPLTGEVATYGESLKKDSIW